MQTHIIACAMQLFRQQGYEATSMEAVAEMADITKRTLYRYFPVKEAIVSGYWQQNVREKSAMLEPLLSRYPDSRSRLIAVFCDAASGFRAEPSFARIHFAYQFRRIGMAGQFRFDDVFDDFLTSVIEAGRQQGDIRHDLPADEIAVQIMLNFTATCLTWFGDPEAFSLEERLEQVVDLFLDGAKRPG